jgi:hypothetical protein
MAGIVRRLAYCQAGAELIEFALVLPLFLLLTMAIIDFGFVFQQYNVVTNAAREGARVAVLPNASPVLAAQQRAKLYIQSAGLDDRGVVTQVMPIRIDTHVDGPRYHGVKVTVTYPCRFIALGPLSALFGAPIPAPTLQAHAAMRDESQ